VHPKINFGNTTKRPGSLGEVATIVLEVLERIKQAEDALAAKRQHAQAEMQAYELAKQERLLQLKTASQEEIKRVLKKSQTLQAEILEQERQQLLAETETITQKLQEQYEKNKAHVIEAVIERVKRIYGSQ
jgi:DNA anti-recombination protein RmuC